MEGKLVRDRIPEIIRSKGELAEYHILQDDDEFKRELLRKLCEEAAELREDPSLGERADVEELLRKIDEVFGYTAEAVETARREKREARGGFDRRIYLEESQ